MKILVGIDGSEHSRGALTEALKVAKKFSAFVKVINVYEQGMDKEAEKVLEEAEQYLKKEKIEHSLSSILGSNPSRALINVAKHEDFDLIVVGSRGLGSVILGSNPSRALINVAKHEDFDLIVVGSRGLGSVASFLLGSVSKQVVSKAHCDVLVAKK